MWYLVITKPVVPREQIQPYMSEHSAWIRQNHEAGRLVATGPAADGSAGIWVIRANSDQEARELADSHPFHARGLRQYEMYGWIVHQFMGQGAFSNEAINALIQQHAAAV